MTSTLALTDDELRILRSALSSFVQDFGHDELDVLRPARQLLQRVEVAAAQLPAAAVEDWQRGS